MTPTRPRAALAAVCSCLAFAIGACGGSDVGSAPRAAGDVGALDPGADTALVSAGDRGVDLGAAADLGAADLPATTDASDGGGSPSGLGSACRGHRDCAAGGWCVPSPDGNVCSVVCVDRCPTGWTCTTIVGTGPDLVSVCVPVEHSVCAPCDDDDECANRQACAGSAPGDPTRCRLRCDAAGRCPDGFRCGLGAGGGGAPVGVCLPDDGTDDCCALATEGVVAPCGGQGACRGERTCGGAAGWGVCRTGPPGTEFCNGLDDDCDGDTDEDGCDDGDPCTVDRCDGAAGCAHPPTTGPACDDGDPCTTDDRCTQGVCEGTRRSGCCVVDGHCPDDGDACTAPARCEPTGDGVGRCVAPGPRSDCPDDEDPCTTAACDAATGACVTTTSPDGAPCSAPHLCGPNGRCEAGRCVGEGRDCDDGDPCTDDRCDANRGCAHIPSSGPCDDGDPCTVGDACSRGTCEPGPRRDCDDGNPCTEGICDPATGCETLFAEGPCDDGDACTLTDRCADGACVGEGSPRCDDGNPCTTDACAPDRGCHAIATDGPCDDGDPCTVDDSCEAGHCIGGGPLDCDDGDPCTVDLCAPLLGCRFEAAEGECDDGEPCTVGERCVDGACGGGSPRACDDRNECTDDICVEGAGCVGVPTEAPCDDGDPCTTGDRCDGAAHCAAGEAVDCDDGERCTVERCVAGVGCRYDHLDGACDDGAPCTFQDRCVAQRCTGSLDGSFAAPLVVGGATITGTAVRATGVAHGQARVLVWSFRGGGDGGRDLYVARSDDAGASWTTERRLRSDRFSNLGEDTAPSLVRSPDGALQVVWSSNNNLSATIGNDADLLTSRSVDGGDTWSRPAPVLASAADDGAEEREPVLVAGAGGDRVLAWTHRDASDPGGPDRDIWFARSADGGATFSEAAPVWSGAGLDQGDDQQPRLIHLGGDQFLLAWSTFDDLGAGLWDDMDLVASRSTDGGATWSPPRPLNLNATRDTGYDYQPALATDGQGAVVAVWQSFDDLDGSIGRDHDILVARSGDGGVTWSTPRPLHAYADRDDGDDLRPTIAHLGGGRWQVAWDSEESLWGHLDGAPNILTVSSDDGGRTWGLPAAVDPHHGASVAPDQPTAVSDDQLPLLLAAGGDALVVWRSLPAWPGSGHWRLVTARPTACGAP